MTLPSQGTVLSQKLLAGGVRAGGGLVPWLNVTSQCHRAVPLLCLCCQHHQLLPRDRWMWPHPLALTSSLLLLPFTRDPKQAGPVQGMLCRTRVAVEPPEHPWSGVVGSPCIHCGFVELLLGPALAACCPLDASWSWDYSRAAFG